MAAGNKETMERDILEAVYDFGEIRPGTPASQILEDKYPSDAGDNSPRIQVTVMLNYLVEERFLFPYVLESSGKELQNGYARGITPKGLDKLQRLRHPVRTWIGENWFPVVVAGITATVGIASIVVNLIAAFNKTA